jgi:hypothetical protein
MKNTSIENLFKRWQEYLSGKKEDETDKSLQSHSIQHTIYEMVDDHFIFKTFNLTGSEMMKKDEKIYANLFCSNQYLIEIMKKGYFRLQCLHIGKLIESSKKIEKTCSLVNLLESIKKNSCHIKRKDFCDFHNCRNASFDAISNKNQPDIIDNEYLDKLIKTLSENDHLKKIKNYRHQVVAHNDFTRPDYDIYMETIEECHKVISKIYREIEQNFFLAHSLCGEKSVILTKRDVLHNADKPFYIK